MNITVFKPKGRTNYVCQWTDPITGRKKTRSTRTKNKRDAERFAGNLEGELVNGTYHEDIRMTWEAFRKRFDEEYLAGKPKNTIQFYNTAFNSLERVVDPKLLQSVNESTISKYQSELRKVKLSDATIGCNLRHIKAALRWAADQKFIPVAPKIRIPKKQGMKGRPITLEEFERMLAKIPMLESSEPESWELLLSGLWLSGLRISEAMNLHWIDGSNLCVDFSQEFPMLVIQAHAQKSKQYEQIPIVPDFAELLQSVPEEERTGYVFNPIPKRNRGTRLRSDTTGSLIARIGKAAGILVGESLSGKKKHASAHDLRRSFGFRWSRQLMPAVLKEIMRHSSIQTTMDYYVGSNAIETARGLWSAPANGLANSAEKAEIPAGDFTPQPVGK